ncbi:MAG TPA: hypothetical protein VE090_01230 [Methylomirabilota bacterium]|nr:hypothetical protein [Methylomirabilota bacterium]
MKFLIKYKKILGNLLFLLFIASILLLSVRGLPGNPTPTELNTTYWKDNGPFELSPERGRFALLYSIVENHSFNFQPGIAKFTAPDVGYMNHQYVSIFAPSVSFVAIPGYILGKYFDISQFGTYIWLALFALLNVFLIRMIAIRLGAAPLAASLAGIAFLFATPAFAYAVTIYEHHVSTFLILLTFYLLIRYNNLFSLAAIWLLYAFSFTVDYPNIFLIFPIAIAAFFRISTVQEVGKKILLHISLPRVLAMAGVIIPLLLFLWFNKVAYGNPFQLSAGSIARVISVKPNGAPVLLADISKPTSLPQVTKRDEAQGSIFTAFKPRNMLNGFYILLVSPDRGVLVFTPVMLLGIIGILIANKKKVPYMSVLLGIIGFDLLLYSMWGDPYGGWAFGARYLIPAYAILAIYIAILLTYWRKNNIFLLFFFTIFSYSVVVNTLGALTSNSNPPKVEAESLSQLSDQEQSYTYARNISELNSNNSKSYIFQTYAGSYISAWSYYTYITIFIVAVAAFFIVYFQAVTREELGEGGQHAL